MFFRFCSALALWGWCGVAFAQFGFLDPVQVLGRAKPAAIAVGDLDQDGVNDVVMLEHNSTAGWGDWKLVLHGSRSPFRPVVSAGLGHWYGEAQDTLLRLADLDNDGDLDAIAYTGKNLCWIRNDRKSFRQLCSSPARKIRHIGFVDGNRDGVTDVLWQAEGERALRLGYSDGGVGIDYSVLLLAPPVDFTRYSDLQVADVDGDSWPDVLYAIKQGVYVHLQQETKISAYPIQLLQLPGTADAPGFAVGDFNSDGRLDLVVDGALADGEPVQVFFQDSNGGYSQSDRVDIPMARGRIRVADVNADGNDDLVMLRGTADASILLGNGDGTFAPELLVPSSFAAPVLVDFDGDGVFDLVEAMSGNGLRYQPGRGAGKTDLRLSMQFGHGAASVRIDNAGTHPSGAILVEIRLAAKVGSVGGAIMPAGCSSAPEGRALVVTCDLPGLAPGEADAFNVPFELDATSANVVTASGSALPTAPDAWPRDNHTTARKVVSASAAPAGATVAAPRGRPAK